MKDFNNATPRPWTFDSSDMNFYNHIGTAVLTVHLRPKIVGQDDIEKSGLSIETKQNAELIDVAVNNFDKMKEAIIKANDKLAYLYGYNLGKDAVSDVPDILNEIEQLLESIK